MNLVESTPQNIALLLPPVPPVENKRRDEIGTLCACGRRKNIRKFKDGAR